MTLDGRVTLVTGGAIRVGRAIVQALAAEGATMAVHHHGSVDEARSLVAELRSKGLRAEAFRADLTDDAQLGSLVADVERTVRFLIAGPGFITGQVIAVDGGRVRGSP